MEIKNRSGFRVMIGLAGFVRPFLGVMGVAVLLGCAGNLMATFIPVLGGYGILKMAGYLEGGIDLPALFVLLGMFAVLRGVCRYGEQACNHYIAFRLLARIRHQVFDALRRLAPAKLDGSEKGNLISILTSDIELLEVFYAHTISPALIAFITSVLMTVFIGSMHVVLGAAAAVFYLLAGGVVPALNRKCGSRRGREYRKRIGKLNTTVLDTLYGLNEIIQYGQQKKQLEKMDGQTKELSKLTKELKKTESVQRVLSDCIVWAAGAFALIVSGILVAGKQMPAAQAVISLIAMLSSFGPVLALGALSNDLNQTLASGDRVLSLLGEEPALEEIIEGEQMENGDIACKGVTFTYGGQQGNILDGFSAVFKKEGIHGIWGGSGCGKSTLLKLMMRFYQTDDGKICYGKQNVDRITTSSLRDHVAYVTQETFLFHDSIAGNIRVAKPDATREEIIEAAKKASVHEFIDSLPEGYETKVAELGGSVSGGEKQRIGLARAFLHEGKAVFLDEPTSSLDSLNEGIILRSLKEEAKGKTIVLVSHRKSTMGIADDMFVMQ